MAENNSTCSLVTMKPSMGYQVQALASHLRAGFSLLEGHPGYGAQDVYGISLVDVGYILLEAVNRLDELYGKLDEHRLS